MKLDYDFRTVKFICSAQTTLLAPRHLLRPSSSEEGSTLSESSGSGSGRRSRGRSGGDVAVVVASVVVAACVGGCLEQAAGALATASTGTARRTERLWRRSTWRPQARRQVAGFRGVGRPAFAGVLHGGCRGVVPCSEVFGGVWW